MIKISPQYRRVVITVTLLLLSQNSIYAKSGPTLSIVYPLSKTVVQSGQEVVVTVVATEASAIDSEYVIGQKPFGASNAQNGNEKNIFSLIVPQNIDPGNYQLRSVAKTKGGDLIYSNPVSVMISRKGEFVKLTLDPQTIMFPYPGASVEVELNGISQDGKRSTLTNSHKPGSITFSIDNTSVATVSRIGLVSAQSPGNALLTANYKNQSTTSTIQVAKTIPGDLNNDQKVDQDDLNTLLSVLNTPANGANDARDLNHDGKIDDLDVRILTTLCTYPKCATHP